MSKIIDGLLHGDLIESNLILSTICEEPPRTDDRPSPNRLCEPIQNEAMPSATEDKIYDIAEPYCIEEPSFVPPETIAEPRSRYRVARVPALRAVLADDTENGRFAGEQYRVARTKITQHSSKPQVILISSVVPGDGKSTTAIRLAASLSLSSRGDVLLVDADFRRNSIGVQLGLKVSSTLADVIPGLCQINEAVVRTQEFLSLCILEAGNPDKNPAELFDSPEWSSLCTALRDRFQYIVIDSPPMSPFADYELLLAVADGLIMVVTPDHTSRHSLANALRTAPKEKFIGVVLNRVPRFFLYKQPHSHYYDYYYANGNWGGNGAVPEAPRGTPDNLH
jgi:capsular exopolysaccharide synthesis family protein